MPQRHSGIHIALQGNDMAGVHPRDTASASKSINIATIIVLRVVWGVNLEFKVTLDNNHRITYRIY